MFVDSHCHIHEDNYPLDKGDIMRRAHEAGVSQMICVGTSEISSREAIAFSKQHERVYASIGVHPHDAKDGYRAIFDHTPDEFIAVGEIGLDYFYSHSPRGLQLSALEEQLQFAIDHDKPVIFHVREAFDDFWPLFESFRGIRGVLHSFTDSRQNLERALERGLYIGVNGISTFTKDIEQQAMFASIPLERMLLETDAPFLTPRPFRGKVNEPAYVKTVAEFHASSRNVLLEEVATRTTTNARELFAI